MEKRLNKICGIFIFNVDKELLLILPSNSNKWTIPIWNHSNHEDYLDVAKKSALELTGIDLFNRKDELFVSHKFYQDKNTEFIPYSIHGEEKIDNFKCWANNKSGFPMVDDWEWFSVKEAKQSILGLQKKSLFNIKY